MSNPASFQLNDYIFNDIKLRFNKELPKDLNIDIIPSGIFNTENSSFDLIAEFIAFSEGDKENPFIEIKCKGTFLFQDVKTL